MDRIFAEARSKLRSELHHLFRFVNMDEVQAARQVLEERGTPMSMDEIVEELKAGGIWGIATGSAGSSADSELKRSIGRAAAHGLNGKSDIMWINKSKGLIGLTPPDMRKKP